MPLEPIRAERQKEIVLLLWRDFGAEMAQLDMIDVEVRLSMMN